jgi:hypothetical protein
MDFMGMSVVVYMLLFSTLRYSVDIGDYNVVVFNEGVLSCMDISFYDLC